MDQRATLLQDSWPACEHGEPVTCMPKVGKFEVHRPGDGPSVGSMAVTESGKRNSEEVGKTCGPTTNYEVELHGRCNDGEKGEYCNAQKKIHGSQFATLYPLVSVMLEVAK